MAGCIYLAHPVNTYATSWSRRGCTEAVRQLLPDADVLDPETMWTSDEEWLAEWPKIVRSLDLLVVFCDDAQTVGTGVLREIADAIAWDVAVLALDPEGRALCDIEAIGLVPERLRTRAEAAELVLDHRCPRCRLAERVR